MNRIYNATGDVTCYRFDSGREFHSSQTCFQRNAASSMLHLQVDHWPQARNSNMFDLVTQISALSDWDLHNGYAIRYPLGVHLYSTAGDNFGSRNLNVGHRTVTLTQRPLITLFSPIRQGSLSAHRFGHQDRQMVTLPPCLLPRTCLRSCNDITYCS